jgi:proteasome lid subunit RPN8/RPN11
VILPDAVAAAIIAHARDAAPHECCGLLLGDRTRIIAAVRANNAADDPSRRYLVDPHDHFAALRIGRSRGQEVIGAYHSHPRSDAAPSATDQAESFEQFLYLIVGLGLEPPEVRAWKLADGNFAPVSLVRGS